MATATSFKEWQSTASREDDSLRDELVSVRGVSKTCSDTNRRYPQRSQYSVLANGGTWMKPRHKIHNQPYHDSYHAYLKIVVIDMMITFYLRFQTCHNARVNLCTVFISQYVSNCSLTYEVSNALSIAGRAGVGHVKSHGERRREALFIHKQNKRQEKPKATKRRGQPNLRRTPSSSQRKLALRAT
uniref:Predicted protein n=1 Tax=Physcomitrium patens TaxID=3218 RepID=A9U6G9_PHYPA